MGAHSLALAPWQDEQMARGAARSRAAHRRPALIARLQVPAFEERKCPQSGGAVLCITPQHIVKFRKGIPRTDPEPTANEPGTDSETTTGEPTWWMADDSQAATAGEALPQLPPPLPPSALSEFLSTKAVPCSTPTETSVKDARTNAAALGGGGQVGLVATLARASRSPSASSSCSSWQQSIRARWAARLCSSPTCEPRLTRA